jgi:hypothetical protein
MRQSSFSIKTAGIIRELIDLKDLRKSGVHRINTGDLIRQKVSKAIDLE